MCCYVFYYHFAKNLKLNLKTKVEENENNARINEKKKLRKQKKYTQALGELKCVYTKKK